jgi:hypothetical protein
MGISKELVGESAHGNETATDRRGKNWVIYYSTVNNPFLRLFNGKAANELPREKRRVSNFPLIYPRP